MFKAPKHAALKGAALLDIAGPAKEESKVSPTKLGRPAQKSTPARGLKPPTKATPATSMRSSAAKKTEASSGAPDLGPAVSHDEDPLAAALQARNKAGGLSSQLKEMDAKK